MRHGITYVYVHQHKTIQSAWNQDGGGRGQDIYRPSGCEHTSEGVVNAWASEWEGHTNHNPKRRVANGNFFFSISLILPDSNEWSNTDNRLFGEAKAIYGNIGQIPTNTDSASHSSMAIV